MVTKLWLLKKIECLVDKQRGCCLLKEPFCSIELCRNVTSSPETTGPIEDSSCVKLALLTGKVLKDISNYSHVEHQKVFTS